MELFSRYRNITVLLLVIFAQLVLLGYQVKSNQDIRLIRVWAVTAITPLARAIEGARSRTADTVGDYFYLHRAADENKVLKAEVGKLKLENQFLRSELDSADRAAVLAQFQHRSQSKTIQARVIGTGTTSTSRVVFIDRGSGSGVMQGMAVITPDGIVGKIISVYPPASQVLLIDDPTFAAGVISQKHRVRGTVRGSGQSKCMVDYIQNEEQVDQGEWFYTSGDDGVFPKGLPVGQVAVARNGTPNKQVYLTPSGLQGGLEEVLVILEGVHQAIPEQPAVSGGVHLQPPPPGEAAPEVQKGDQSDASGAQTEADRLRARYRKVGEAQGHKFGEGLPGSKPPDFNLSPEEVAARAKAAAVAAAAKQAQAAGQAGGGAIAPAKPAAGSGTEAPAPRAVAPAPPKPANPGTATVPRTNP